MRVAMTWGLVDSDSLLVDDDPLDILHEPEVVACKRTAEGSLLLRELRDVLHTLLDSRNVDDRAEDLWWVFYDPHPERPYSFRFVCEHLGLDPAATAASIRCGLESRDRMLPELFCHEVAGRLRRRRSAPEQQPQGGKKASLRAQNCHGTRFSGPGYTEGRPDGLECPGGRLGR